MNITTKYNIGDKIYQGIYIFNNKTCDHCKNTIYDDKNITLEDFIIEAREETIINIMIEYYAAGNTINYKTNGGSCISEEDIMANKEEARKLIMCQVIEELYVGRLSE